MREEVPNILVLKDYHMSRAHKLGEGSMGAVYLGQNIRQNYKVAIKEIKKTKLTEEVNKQIFREVTCLGSIKSPYVVNFYECFSTEQCVYLIFQYCEHGDLKKYMDRRKGEITEEQATKYIQFIVQGYRALYQKKIIHRDIKPANIFLKDGIIKLGDFGFSRVINDPNESQALTLLGTPLYTAPQILLSGNFCSKCDVWSVGVVWYEMLHGCTPWVGTDLRSLRFNIESITLRLRENISAPVKSVLSRMLQTESKQRITWQQIFRSPIFANQLPAQVPITQPSYAECKAMLSNHLTKHRFRSQGSGSKVCERVQFQRNLAMFYAFLLDVYYREKDKVPKDVNLCMEFEFALVMKALATLKEIVSSLNQDVWKTFLSTPVGDQMQRIMNNDFNLLNKLRKKIKVEAEKLYKAFLLPQQTIKLFKSLETNFQLQFVNIMRNNLKILSDVENRVCELLKQYIQQIVLSKDTFSNTSLDFKLIYENLTSLKSD